MIVELAAQKVSRQKKLEAFDAVRVLYQREAEALNEQLIDGRLTPLLWNVAMKDLVKDLHVQAYAIGRSGQWSTITPREWGRNVSGVLRRQYQYLRNWAAELYDLSSTTLAQVNARAALYAASARQSFERGMVAELGIDAIALPAYPGDGTSDCLVNCRCRWSVRILSKARTDFDVSWRLGHAEHCRTCRARARHRDRGGWQQLRIRRGVMIDSPAPLFASR